MQIIGAGFSRTGTYSLRQALEHLGYNPCYHGEVVLQRPDHVATWLTVTEQLPDWQSLFSEYKATVDSPACFYWKELLAAYPNAKVILTVRDPDAWYDSFKATLYEAMIHPERTPAEIQGAMQMARKVVLEQSFDDRFEDRAHAISVYESHIASVKAHFEGNESGLLVYKVEEGWPPLCSFLGCEIPEAPFPNTNARSAFVQMFT